MLVICRHYVSYNVTVPLAHAQYRKIHVADDSRLVVGHARPGSRVISAISTILTADHLYDTKSGGAWAKAVFVRPSTVLNRRQAHASQGRTSIVVPHHNVRPRLRMQLTLNSVAAAALLAPTAHALLRFSCSQLVVERLDPLVSPGAIGSPHVHQVIGGNAFNASMEYPRMDIPSEATCTTCTFAEDLSNYWTAVLYFRARNGTFKRVQQMPNAGFEGSKGGMTVYYTPSYNGGKVTAFKPVSRAPFMFVKDKREGLTVISSRVSV